MLKRQRITPGAILEIQSEGKYYYSQILQSGNCAFFNYVNDSPLNDLSILEQCSVLFILAVYNDVITNGKWLKVGKLNLRNDLKIEPYQFIQDPLKPNNFELYNPITGEIKKATREQCFDLERAAVWEADHVEGRLRDYFEGKQNIWEERLKIK